MNEKPTSRKALERCASLPRHGGTWFVSMRHHNFHTMKPERFECVACQPSRSSESIALPLAGLSYPVAEIAEFVLCVDLIQSGTADERAVSDGEKAKFVCAPSLRSSSRYVEPLKRFLY